MKRYRGVPGQGEGTGAAACRTSLRNGAPGIYVYMYVYIQGGTSLDFHKKKKLLELISGDIPTPKNLDEIQMEFSGRAPMATRTAGRRLLFGR